MRQAPDQVPGLGRSGSSSRIACCAFVGCGRLSETLVRALRSQRIFAFHTDGRPGDVARMLQREPDLLVLGTHPISNGVLRLLGELPSPTRRCPVLLLLDGPDLRLARKATALGVDDVLQPPHSVSRILFRGALLCTNRGRRSRHNPRIAIQGRRLQIAGWTISLTPTQALLMEALLADGGKRVDRAQLVNAVWSGRQATQNGLDVTIYRLRMRLERALGCHDAIVTEPRGGYSVDTAMLEAFAIRKFGGSAVVPDLSRE